MEILDNDYLDFDTRLEYRLPLNGERINDNCSASSDEAETDHEAQTTRIPRTPEPELPTTSHGILRPRTLGLKQRALIRILAHQKHIPSSKLAPYFKVSVGVVYSARYNYLKPKDDVEQGVPKINVLIIILTYWTPHRFGYCPCFGGQAASCPPQYRSWPQTHPIFFDSQVKGPKTAQPRCRDSDLLASSHCSSQRSSFKCFFSC
jgi:hypothetical protein